MKTSEEYIPTRLWWSAQRRCYNKGLFFAGIIAFVCYATVVFTFEKRIPDADITIFTTLFQGIGYLFMMAVANVLYFLGPISERAVNPSDIMRFRKLTFGLWLLGVGVSALPHTDLVTHFGCHTTRMVDRKPMIECRTTATHRTLVRLRLTGSVVADVGAIE